MIGALTGPAGAQPRPHLHGVWLMQNGKAEVEVQPCGDAICGRVSRIVRYPKDGARTDIHNVDATLRNRPLVGLPVLMNFRADGGALQGRVYDPKSGRSFRGTLYQVSPDRLTVKACLLFICKSQEWKRVR